MPIGTVTKRFDNEKNIRVTFDNDRDKTYSTNKRDLYPILQEGNRVDYTLVTNGNYTNISAAILLGGASPATPGATGAPAPSGPRSTLTEKDTLIVDQVLFKGAIDLMVKHDPSPEGAAEMAVFAWNAVLYYRHGGAAPLVLEAMKEGGHLLFGEVTDPPAKSGLRDLDIDLPPAEAGGPLADILNNPPREPGEV